MDFINFSLRERQMPGTTGRPSKKQLGNIGTGFFAKVFTKAGNAIWLVITGRNGNDFTGIIDSCHDPKLRGKAIMFDLRHICDCV